MRYPEKKRTPTYSHPQVNEGRTQWPPFVSSMPVSTPSIRAALHRHPISICLSFRPDLESWSPGAKGDVDATLNVVEQELVEEFHGKHPQSCDSGRQEAKLALAWLAEVRRSLALGDTHKAVQNAYWLGVCRERMGVVRLEQFALKTKEQRGHQSKKQRAATQNLLLTRNAKSP